MNVLIKMKGIENDYLFLTLEENGEKKYYLNNCEVDKNSGNKTYLEIIKKTDRIIEVIKITEDNKKDVMEYFLKGYDKYVQYIDDYSQYRRQERRNDMIYTYIELINKCVKTKDEKEIKELYKKYVW